MRILEFHESAHHVTLAPAIARVPTTSELEALDPAAVAARLRPEHRAGHCSQAFIRIYVRFLAHKSPNIAMAWISTLPPAVAAFACKTVVEDAAASSTANAMAVLDLIPAQLRSHFNDFGNLPWPLAREAPRQFLLWLDAHAGRIQKDVLGFLSRGWLQKDREAAAAWILTHCQPALQDSLLGRPASK